MDVDKAMEERQRRHGEDIVGGLDDVAAHLAEIERRFDMSGIPPEFHDKLKWLTRQIIDLEVAVGQYVAGTEEDKLMPVEEFLERSADIMGGRE